MKPTVTPMMEQYLKIRDQLPVNTLLLFRLGDFYELFFKDAHEASTLLGITLTHRHNTPMAGIPFHAAENYINKLLRAGKKVAICDQVETPKAGKLVKRELTRILTPGTTLDASQIIANQNHYLLALNIIKGRLNAAWMDLSTGGFAIASDQSPHNLLPIFNALDPKEILIPEIASNSWKSDLSLASWYEQFKAFTTLRPVTTLPDYLFDHIQGAKSVMDSLGVLNLEGFGIHKDHPALGPGAALIAYATDNLCAPPKNLRSVKEYRPSEALLLDPATMRNLEIFKSSSNHSREGTLIQAMDATVTCLGARLLEEYLTSPLSDIQEITRRQDCVQDFIQNPSLINQSQSILKHVRDITRILSRLQNKIRNPRELGAIKETLNQLPSLIATLSQFQGHHVHALIQKIDPLDELSKTLNLALSEELPSKIQDGGFIKKNYDPQLDYLKSLTSNNKSWIAELEKTEQQNTNIKNLKVRYNGAFGYYIEITKSYLHLVPNHYIRKQTMTNAERFVTEELKIKEKEILNAEENALAREEEIFLSLVQKILEFSDALSLNASTLAQIDLFLAWAHLAIEWDYTKPSVDNSDLIRIEQGRHPVVEQMIRNDRLGLAGSHSFVANDTFLKSDNEQIALITGPNMAGKSTYIRQVALITLMAQVGSWVPALHAHIGIVDRIFSRIGASDELARGNSTFMVEMNETANILNNATDKSLIILDEIGRGTSTYDGLSIAWAVVEFLHQNPLQGPKTLFATHYHEITKLEASLPRLKNYSVSVREHNDQIIFIRQVIPGPADRSYGIQVAKLAGLPPTVISRAKDILFELESEGQVLQQQLLRNKSKSSRSPKPSPEESPQLSFF